MWLRSRSGGSGLALPEDTTIGIIGGGQLGRMLAMAAAKLGLKTVVLDPDPNAPAAQCTNGIVVAEYGDINGLAELARQCDVLTYEFENVDVEAIEGLQSKVPCFPDTRALSTTQDRLVEKRFFNSIGVATAPFFPVDSAAALENALAETEGKGILKTRRFGYDGKGQVLISPQSQGALEGARTLLLDVPCILEGLVAFEREISIIAARSVSGEIQSFDPAENVHRDGILRSSTVPAQVDQSTVDKAGEIATKVLEALDYVGVIGIEFFVMADGGLLANEFAPRVHNSGHWTEAACAVSQFEQHIRAIANMPLGDTRRHSDCEMKNLIGDDVTNVSTILTEESTLLHLYGKAETRDGRKMGHFTKIYPRKG